MECTYEIVLISGANPAYKSATWVLGGILVILLTVLLLVLSVLRRRRKGTYLNFPFYFHLNFFKKNHSKLELSFRARVHEPGNVTGSHRIQVTSAQS